MSPHPQAIYHEIIASLGRAPADVGFNAVLSDVGADYYDAIVLHRDLERAFQVKLPADAIQSTSTVLEVIEAVKAAADRDAEVSL